MLELSLNILDIAQNSFRAGADLIAITIYEDSCQKEITVIIEDNGSGMSKETVKSVTDPFFTSRETRKIGMGIPLFKMAAEMTGGSFTLESEPGVGTRVSAVFKSDSIDFIPLGDMGQTLSLLFGTRVGTQINYSHRVDGSSFELESETLQNILGDVPLNTPEVSAWISEYVNQQIDIIHGGV